ncbi:MAG: polyphosphate polymerase domain-containing protein [Opitutaceae bacterium]
MSPSAPNGHEKREFASEIKFLVDPATAERVRAWARDNLERDPNAREDTYGVTSLYYDTTDFTVFRREGHHRHSKFRIRRYDGATLFLERKLKVAGRVAKHRTRISPAELDQLIRPFMPAWPGKWFENKTAARRLRPVCQIDYLRTARVLATPAGPIRLTLDENLRALAVHDPRFHDAAHAKSLTDRVVLELKFRRDLPLLFRTLAADFGLNPQPFSKYRAAVQALQLAPTTDRSPAPARPAATLLAPNIVACPTS